MRFVPKFHNDLIIKLIIFTAIYFLLLFPMAFGDVGEKINLIQVIGVYIITVVYFFISWFILNLLENTFIYERENENYYRDIIKNISPAQLSYIEDYGVEHEKDILGTILMLHLKGNIKIKNNKIEFISRYKVKEAEYYNLSKTETLVLDCISKNESPFRMENTFEKLLIEELAEASLIEKEETVPPHFYVKKILQIIYGILIIVYASLTDDLISHIITYGIGVFSIIHAVMWLVVPQISGSDKYLFLDVYKKLTRKGNEIRLKLTGLKLFLRDYSDMKNKDLKEIELWDEYIIYSVILNDNKKLQKEILKIVRKQYKF